MNEIQETLLEIIYQISNVKNVFKFGNSTTYGLKNYIARYSLASDQYYITCKALNMFEILSIPSPLTRSTINKKLFTYEHAIPVSVISKYIDKSNKSKMMISTLLDLSDCVTILTKEEDKMLQKTYNFKMPKEWKVDDGDPFMRYQKLGIKLSTRKWRVIGALKR